MFSFSPVSYHVSFVTGTEVTILDIRKQETQETLLHKKVAQPLYKPPGHFSPDGRFFVCGTWEDEIFVWEKKPTGYVHWCTVTSRLPFSGFSFSPTAASLLTWAPGKIQMLRPEPRAIQSPNKTELRGSRGRHLVACSTDGKHIAIVRNGESVVTVLDRLSGNPKQPINTGMRIRDIEITGNTMFVTDGHKFFSYDLGTTGSAQDIRRGTVDETSATDPSNIMTFNPLVLSKDCSKIVSAHGKVVVARDINTRKVVGEYTASGSVDSIQFSPDGCRLLLIVEPLNLSNSVELELAEERGFSVTTSSMDPWSGTGYSSNGYSIEDDCQWVVDPSGRRLLWLPPNWRIQTWRDVWWSGDLLALVHPDHPDPILIEFKL